MHLAAGPTTTADWKGEKGRRRARRRATAWLLVFSFSVLPAAAASQMAACVSYWAFSLVGQACTGRAEAPKNRSLANRYPCAGLSTVMLGVPELLALRRSSRPSSPLLQGTSRGHVVSRLLSLEMQPRSRSACRPPTRCPNSRCQFTIPAGRPPSERPSTCDRRAPTPSASGAARRCTSSRQPPVPRRLREHVVRGPS